MKAVPLKEAEGQLGKLIAEVYQGETIVITDGDREVTLVAPAGGLNLEEDSPELEAELLKAVNGPHSPMREGELREIADQALREYRAKRQK
jgi:antitoxin (DNA-binding transcriptional repressor) of toxin-antitoxin stability system